MKRILLLLFLLPLFSFAQSIPPKMKLITVKNVSFEQVCNKILDAGYLIDKKDNDLKTVKTERKDMPKFTAFYTINVRVKDSVAYISGIVRAPESGFVYKDEPVFSVLSKNGGLKERDIMGYAFIKLNELAQSLGGEVQYSKN